MNNERIPETLHDTREDWALVCPYCGYRHDDSNEFGLDEHDSPVECEKCGDRFMARCEVRYTYIGSIIE